MQKRVIIDLDRHAQFYEVLSKNLPELKLPEAATKRKRQRITIQPVVCGDPIWSPNACSLVDLCIHRDGTWINRKINSTTFFQVIHKVMEDTTWIQKLGETRKDWYLAIPSFLYNVLCKQPAFCKVTGIDPVMTGVFSVGRYVYLADMFKGGSRETSPIITRMILWLVVAENGNKDIRRIVSMLERSIEDPLWWDTDLIKEDLIIGSDDLGKDRDSVESMINLLDFRWFDFFKELPDIIERFHEKPKNSSSYSKSSLGEGSTSNRTLDETIQLMRRHRMWGDLARLRLLAKSQKESLTSVLFEDTTVTIDQVHSTMRILFDEWGKWWAKDRETINGLYVVLRSPEGVLLVSPSSWISEIQGRLLPFLCLHPSFHRRHPVPIAPWLTDKYFSGQSLDREMVMRTFYRLIHMYTRENSKSFLASPDERDLFWVYDHLHEILNHFCGEQQIVDEFQRIFEDSENLYFQKRRGKSEDEEILMGIKNMQCLHRALKSILEIKAPHYIGSQGIRILENKELLGIEDLPCKEGLLTREETLAVYKLCATTRLQSREALQLFYDIYVQGDILFTAKLAGAENWDVVSPFLQSYNTKVLETIGAKMGVSKDAGKVPCVALYYTFRTAEHMAHYPFRLTRKEFSEGTKSFRGKIKTSALYCDPRDFLVNDCRCPLMLHAENMSGSPKAWFSEDMFPLCGPRVFHGPTLKITHPWKDLRPFEDADPLLLEFLVAQ